MVLGLDLGALGQDDWPAALAEDWAGESFDWARCQAHINSLQTKEIPYELQSLNILEKHLISIMIPFMKLVVLPKSGQKQIHGQCVLVPSNIQQTLNCLPYGEGSLLILTF